ncbi:MAG: GHKL domain-containing protein [Oscillospiraceae bacterium]|nr:GHKL domain-containing protein [Oscillospiraceae bacterium]
MNGVALAEKLPMEKRRVKIGSRQGSDSILTLCVDNPYSGSVRLGRDGLPRAKRVGHGVGLVSVAATVHRYNGTMSIRTEDSLFSVGIVPYAK